MITKFGRLTNRYQFPASVHVDREGKIVIQGTHHGIVPTRRIRSDEGCRGLVGDLLGFEPGSRPVLITFRQACKLYALAWALADVLPEEPTWLRVITRFVKMSARAARFWEYASIGFDCVETAKLFRALVFSERSRAAGPNRILIERPYLDVIHKAIKWNHHDDYSLSQFGRACLPVRHPANLTASGLPRAKRLPRRAIMRWAGVICPKPATLLLMPVNYLRRPYSGCSVIVTNIENLRVPPQGCGKKVYTACALDLLAERIAEADPSASAHSLIAMQGPLLLAAEELRAAARLRRG